MMNPSATVKLAANQKSIESWLLVAWNAGRESRRMLTHPDKHPDTQAAGNVSGT